MGRRPPARGGAALNPHWAESLARSALEARGWTTLAANVRRREGEIDLVMDDGEAVVFVEVKQRRADAHGGAAHSLGPAKQARLRRTALAWLAACGRHEDPVRFDAMLVEGDPAQPRLRWLRDAF